jgi:hypothetical protein
VPVVVPKKRSLFDDGDEPTEDTYVPVSDNGKPIGEETTTHQINTEKASTTPSDSPEKTARMEQHELEMTAQANKAKTELFQELN